MQGVDKGPWTRRLGYQDKRVVILFPIPCNNIAATIVFRQNTDGDYVGP